MDLSSPNNPGDQWRSGPAPSPGCEEARNEPEGGAWSAPLQHHIMPPSSQVVEKGCDSVMDFWPATPPLSFSRSSTNDSYSSIVTYTSCGDDVNVFTPFSPSSLTGSPPVYTCPPMSSVPFHDLGISPTPRVPESTSTPCRPDKNLPTPESQRLRGLDEGSHTCPTSSTRRRSYHQEKSVQRGNDMFPNKRLLRHSSYIRSYNSVHPSALSNEVQLSASLPAETSRIESSEGSAFFLPPTSACKASIPTQKCENDVVARRTDDGLHHQGFRPLRHAMRFSHGSRLLEPVESVSANQTPQYYMPIRVSPNRHKENYHEGSATQNGESPVTECQRKERQQSFMRIYPASETAISVDSEAGAGSSDRSTSGGTVRTTGMETCTSDGLDTEHQESAKRRFAINFSVSPEHI